MSTLSRKQREIQDRERRILDVALRMLLEHSYHGLSMDRIAEELEYSKGTIYQHFTCKEDILVALAGQALQARLDLFRRGALFKGRSRERMQAVGMGCELFLKLYPHFFIVEQVLRLDSVREKTSDQRRAFMEHCEHSCVGTIGGVVRDAVASGDLTLPQSITPEEVLFGLWSINFGAATIISTSSSLAESGIKNPVAALRWHCLKLMDGMGWRPLTGEYDPDALDQRLAEGVFPLETRRLKEMQISRN